jgi:conjugal transfer mating pair stabilization protein TraN
MRNPILIGAALFATALVMIGLFAVAAHADAFADGRAFGSSGNAMISSTINEQSGSNTVPGYSYRGSAAAEGSYFAGGNGMLSGIGMSKQIGCATTPGRPSDDCQAINYISGQKSQCDQLYLQINSSLIPAKKRCEELLARSGLSLAEVVELANCQQNPALQSYALTQYVRQNCDDVRARPAITISRADPVMQTAQTVTRNPDSVLAAAPGSALSLAGGYYTGCQTTTSTTPTIRTTDSCYEYLATVRGASCNEARDVQVDPGHDLIPGTPCTIDANGDCVGGTPDIPARAPSVIRDVAPSPCQAYAPDGVNVSGCRTRTVCTDGPSTRTYGWDSSLQITHDCWAWDRDYACEETLPAPVNNCSGFQASGCQFLRRTCTEHNIDGNCVTYKHDYQCSRPGTSSTMMNCADRKFCLEGNCFDAGAPPDRDFANAVIGKEALREAGVYQEGGRLFNGRDSRCEFWPARCCSGGGGGGYSFSNHAINAGASAAYSAAGSTYMYDALFASEAPNWVISGFESMFASGGMESGLAGILSGEITISGLMAGMTTETFMAMVTPSPWMLAIIAYQVIMSCPDDAAIVAMKKDTGLCVEVGEYCSRRLPIFRTCIQKKRGYCCFNSRLAKIINQEGKRQLGRGNGSGSGPDCSGLTPEDFRFIDMSRADPAIWNEFIEQIAPTMPELADITGRAGDSVPELSQGAQQRPLTSLPTDAQQRYQNYFQR